jgi:hypothetical protein
MVKYADEFQTEEDVEWVSDQLEKHGFGNPFQALEGRSQNALQASGRTVTFNFRTTHTSVLPALYVAMICDPLASVLLRSSVRDCSNAASQPAFSFNDVAPSVLTTRVNDPSPAIRCHSTAITPAKPGSTELVSDDFAVFHVSMARFN